MKIERITAEDATRQAIDWDLSIRREDDDGRVYQHDPDGSVSHVIWWDDFEFVVDRPTAERLFAWAL
ncbi:hypothetical protein [Devosia nitrariae]|uniref:Uncharacterized protein n=1 Tax=Devosia nitrariae TaxID=2071872 RepID=A0ABQ5W195_9HYPH|nr:hypothetical protein [Devosia nitrariae]GLQ53576.1 hypothetical protein GCM10010862_08350 [Devosia nitrariae]